MSTKLRILGLVTAATLAGSCNLEVHEDGHDESDPWMDGGGQQACFEYCAHLAECGTIQVAERSACRRACLRSMEADEETASDVCQCVSGTVCWPETDLWERCGQRPLPYLGEARPDGNDRWEDGTGADGADSVADKTAGADPVTDPGSGGATHLDEVTAAAPSPAVEDNDQRSDGTGAGGESSVGDETKGADPGIDQRSAPDASLATAVEVAPIPAQCTKNHDCANNEDCIAGQCLLRCLATCQCPAGQACNATGYCEMPTEMPPDCIDECDCMAGYRCEAGQCV
ncbi:hypothetical protein ACFL5O_10100 [Myxococcota bacterium]